MASEKLFTNEKGEEKLFPESLAEKLGNDGWQMSVETPAELLPKTPGIPDTSADDSGDADVDTGSEKRDSGTIQVSYKTVDVLFEKDGEQKTVPVLVDPYFLEDGWKVAVNDELEITGTLEERNIASIDVLFEKDGEEKLFSVLVDPEILDAGWKVAVDDNDDDNDDDQPKEKPKGGRKKTRAATTAKPVEEVPTANPPTVKVDLGTDSQAALDAVDGDQENVKVE